MRQPVVRGHDLFKEHWAQFVEGFDLPGYFGIIVFKGPKNYKVHIASRILILSIITRVRYF